MLGSLEDSPETEQRLTIHPRQVTSTGSIFKLRLDVLVHLVLHNIVYWLAGLRKHRWEYFVKPLLTPNQNNFYLPTTEFFTNVPAVWQELSPSKFLEKQAVGASVKNYLHIS